MRQLSAALLSWLCFALAMPSRAQSADSLLTPAEIARRTFPSVVLLTMNDQRGQPFAIGSGFFIDHNVVVTNFHVVAQTAGGFAKILGQQSKFPIKGIVAIDPARDLALLEFEGTEAPPLPITPQPQIEIGDAVFVVGNPQGLEATFSQGIVSGFREVGTTRLMQMTAPISPGSSGGPVLDQSGQVVGVSVGGVMHGENLNFAIPAEYLLSLKDKRTETRTFKVVPQFDLAKTALGQLGARPPRNAVTGEKFVWKSDETVYERTKAFSFSLHNTLSADVTNVRGLAIFYDPEGHPIDTFAIDCQGTIAAQASKRLTGEVDQSVQELSEGFYWWDNAQRIWRKQQRRGIWEVPRKAKTETRHGKVEFRILDFVVQ